MAVDQSCAYLTGAETLPVKSANMWGTSWVKLIAHFGTLIVGIILAVLMVALPFIMMVVFWSYKSIILN